VTLRGPASILAIVAAWSAPADGEPARGKPKIDWARGLVVARGAAAGDLRAPSAAVARVGAERAARADARERLQLLARDVPLASGGDVGAAVAADAAAGRRLAAAVDRALDLQIDYASDGSVLLEAGLPIEAVRAAVYGADPAAAGVEAGDPPVTALVIDARRLRRGPAVGLRLEAGSESYRGPTVFAASLDLAGRDPRAGAHRVSAVATAHAGGALTIDLDPRTLAAARRAGALVVVVTRKAKP
jgi:hypothetical protein